MNKSAYCPALYLYVHTLIRTNRERLQSMLLKIYPQTTFLVVCTSTLRYTVTFFIFARSPFTSLYVFLNVGSTVRSFHARTFLVVFDVVVVVVVLRSGYIIVAKKKKKKR